jgi:cellobiose epimerase
VDTDKHWWPQAEAVVGFLNAYQLSADPTLLDAALHSWSFIQERIVDAEGGEWFFRVSQTGEPYREEDKVGLWKCPYHNARACLEVLHRTEGGGLPVCRLPSLPVQTAPPSLRALPRRPPHER